MPVIEQEPQQQTPPLPVPTVAAAPPYRQSLTSGPSIPAAPYGADRLGNTNLDNLQASILQQFDDSGINRPFFTALSPASFAKKPETIFTGAASPLFLIGNNDPKYFESLRSNYFINNFPSQHSCDAIGITPAEFDAFAALHESIHYVSYSLNKDGKPSGWNPTAIYKKIVDETSSPADANSTPLGQTSSSDQIKTSIQQVRHTDWKAVVDSYMDNNLNAGTAQKIIINSLRLQSDSDLADFHFSKEGIAAIKAQVPDRMADAGAALYALSNYSDTAHTKALFEKIRDYRNAILIDPDHDTGSSIDAALDAFSKNPRKGISIAEATKWAATVVENDPYLDQSLYDLGQSARARMDAGTAIAVNPLKPFSEIWRPGPTDPMLSDDPVIRAREFKETQKAATITTLDINKAIQSRNSICSIGP